MKLFTLIAITISSLTVASRADAHFIWAVVGSAGKSLRMEVAESPGESIVPMLGKLIPSIKEYGVADLNDEADHMHIGASVKGNSPVGGVDLLYGIHGTDLIHWSAKGAGNLQSAEKAIGLPAEILIHRSKAGLIALVLKNGKPSPGAEVEVYVPGGKAALNLKTGADGAVRLPAMKHGMLAIGALVKEAVAGDYKGAHYEDKIDMSSLTVQLG